MVFTNPRRKYGDYQRITRGKIGLESELAEIFFRNIAIKSIRKIPQEYLK
jgi:hypothetical protein